MRTKGGGGATPLTKATPARLLVIFAYIGREVCYCDGSDVGGCFDRADSARGFVRVLGDEGLIVGGAFVGSVAAGGRSIGAI